eukprot:COSAG06_NODE_28419_length_574_cov_4.071579_1_plen_62_part_00
MSIYELETTTTGKTMARQEDAFIHTRTSHETLLVGKKLGRAQVTAGGKKGDEGNADANNGG